MRSESVSRLLGSVTAASGFENRPRYRGQHPGGSWLKGAGLIPWPNLANLATGLPKDPAASQSVQVVRAANGMPCLTTL
jgi:hypothetical protein